MGNNSSNVKYNAKKHLEEKKGDPAPQSVSARNDRAASQKQIKVDAQIEHAKSLMSVAVDQEKKYEYEEAHLYFVKTAEVMMQLLKVTIDDENFQKALKEQISVVISRAESNKALIARRSGHTRNQPIEEEKARPQTAGNSNLSRKATDLMNRVKPSIFGHKKEE